MISEALGRMEAAKSIGNRIEWLQFKSEVNKLIEQNKKLINQNKDLSRRCKEKEKDRQHYKAIIKRLINE